MLDDTPRSPDWWLIRLGKQLRDRQKLLDLWWDYYRGNHPLPQGPRKATEAYRDFQRKARTNFCQTVVDASVHRLQVIGFAGADGRPDAEVWGWWQRNRLDARQKQVYRTSLWASVAYMMVGPHPADPTRPLITPEHPEQVITEDDPETGERAAGLKAWFDDIDGVARATVYLPEVIARYEKSGRALTWSRSAWKQVDEQDNPLEGVPIVAYPCRPELGEDPVSEFDSVIDIQLRINMGVLNRMTAERYSAFRQKYVTGHKFAKKEARETDPETGLVSVRTKATENPFRPGPDNVWVSEGENTRFGQFDQTDLIGYLKTYEADIRTLLAVSETPSYVVAGDLVNISTDTVTALDTLHVSKVLEHQAFFGESHEDVLALAAKVAGVDRDLSASEVRWKDPRQLNPAVVADMGSKKKAMGYPLALVAEDMGESPQRVARLRAEQAADQLQLSLGIGAPAQPAPAAAGGGGEPVEE